jgi:hypothetical protein
MKTSDFLAALDHIDELSAFLTALIARVPEVAADLYECSRDDSGKAFDQYMAISADPFDGKTPQVSDWLAGAAFTDLSELRSQCNLELWSGTAE